MSKIDNYLPSSLRARLKRSAMFAVMDDQYICKQNYWDNICPAALPWFEYYYYREVISENMFNYPRWKDFEKFQTSIPKSSGG